MKRANLLVLLILGLAAAGVLGLFLSRQSSSAPIANTPTGSQPAPSPTQAASVPATGNPLLDAAGVSGSGPAVQTGSFFDTSSSIILHLLLAVLLSAVLAFRPRKNFPLFQRNLYVAQTQILLSAVAAALMMIVGDNAARAFAIFAAVSIVRFRTNIRDPKEVTVLLISLALGLAAGVGRWDLGIALCAFSLVLLWLLEYNEQEQAFRSMELTVRTRNTDHTQEILRRLFRKYKLSAEVRELDPTDADESIGKIQYYLNLRLNLSTDDLSDRIMATDPNVEGIQWSKTKNATDVYQ
ncbi:MAG: DUF4956 domain-containing protein [bacterium]|nr:DUF4956 domain-containing protein [bacterium]